MVTATYTIPAGNLPDFGAAMAKLAKRAAKLGVTMPTFSVGPLNEKIVIVNELTGEKKVTQWYEVTLTASPIVIGGWTFIGTLDHTSEAGIILRAVPGVTLDTKFRDAKPVCNHCGYERRRNSTFILVNDDGVTKQVGRNCLQDFFEKDPHLAAKNAEFLAALHGAMGDFEDENFGGGGGRSTATVLLDYLEWVAKEIRESGWVSRTIAKERSTNATADMASNTRYHYYKDGRWPGRDGQRIDPPTDADKATAAAALDWARELTNRTEELNDYLHNVSVVAAGESVSMRNLGIAASIISTHLRELNREAELRKGVPVLSEHFGTVGKREVFTLTVLGFNSFEGAYGVRTLVRLQDAAGRIAVWWTGEPSDDFERGKVLVVKATVKGHDDYKGTKQTTLTRVSIEPTAEQKAADAAIRKAEAKRRRIEKAEALAASPAGDPLNDPAPVSEWFK